MNAVDWGRLMGQTMGMLFVCFVFIAPFTIKRLRPYLWVGSALGLVVGALLTHVVATNTQSLQPWLGWTLAAAFVSWRTWRKLPLVNPRSR